MLRRIVDALIFSSLWLAAAAAGLTAAAAQAMESPPDPRAVGLAAAGTLVVYNVDRLRDLARDRRTAPSRSAYITRHRTGLVALAAAALAPAAALAFVAGPGSVLLLLPVAAVGLLHRRLKRRRYAKSLYVTAAWLTVVVGLPWLLAPAPVHPVWTASVLGLALLANAVASGIRDHEAAALQLGPTGALAAARGAAAAALVLALVAPPPVRGLLPVPALTLAALLGFRSDERYGLLVVDGALLVGAGLALAAR